MSPSPALPAHGSPVTLLIPNMHCPSCVESITAILEPIQQVTNLNISLLLRTVTFSIDSSIGSSTGTTYAQIFRSVIKSLQDGGFTVDSADWRPEVTRKSRASHSASTSAEHTSAFGQIWRIITGQSSKERKKEEERRRQHLSHCKTCQEGRTNALQSIDSTSSLLRVQREHSEEKAKGKKVYRTILTVGGMTCASCVNNITSGLKDNPSIKSVEINLLASSGVVEHDEAISAEDLVSEIEDLGYDASIVSSVQTSPPIDSEEKHVDEKDSGLMKTLFSIEGMTCSSCSNAISTALRDQEGIEQISIDVVGNSATIIHQPKITPEEIAEKIEDIGYGAETISSTPMKPQTQNNETRREKQEETRSVHVKVEGTYCHDCIDKINLYLSEIPLATFTSLKLRDPSSQITYNPRMIKIREILAGLDGLAPEFESAIVRVKSVSERSRDIQKREVKLLIAHFGIAFVFAIPTFIIAIVGMILLPSSNPFRHTLMQPKWGAANLGTIIIWPLATIVQFGVGRLFYQRSMASLRRQVLILLRSLLPSKTSKRLTKSQFKWRVLFNFGSMDLLVALSTSVAYFSSIAMLIIDVRSNPSSESVGTYFDSCVFLITFILVGRVLESYARSRTTDAVTLLGNLRPATALLLEDQNLSIGVLNKNSGSTGESSDEEGSAQENEKGFTAGQSRQIPVEQLEKGDFILIPPGSLPPTDGMIVQGTTTFDESSLTGESRPVPKEVGDEIFTGTTNMSSAITMKVTSLPSETMLDKIISAVSDASAHKAPIEKLAERLTGVFVPIIVYLAIVVLIIWLSLVLTGKADVHGGESGGGKVFYAIEFAISTLVVACPCGIGLAVPCANAVGNGLAAKLGILASGGGEAFLAATKVKTIVVDKTGTLTEGKSRVTDSVEWPKTDAPRGTNTSLKLPRTLDDEVLERIVQDLEKGSTHPLAKGIVEYLTTQRKLRNDDGKTQTSFQIQSSEELPGRGLKASVEVDGQPHLVLVGNLALMEEHQVSTSAEQNQKLEEWYSQAKSVVLVATGPTTPSNALESQITLFVAYALSDPPRTTTKSIISTLQPQGKEVIMLSGDNITTCQAVAEMVGIEKKNVRGGISPIGKAEAIKVLQDKAAISTSFWSKLHVGSSARQKATGKEEKSKVMFVGDGLNDAVALAAADVSVAMGHGSQAILASSDFVLLSSNLEALPALFKLSRKVYNRQRLNLLWAIIFNLVCIPFAMGVFVPVGLRLTPVWSAILMAASSVTVILSSLAMRWGL